jgi:hypothetical protein
MQARRELPPKPDDTPKAVDINRRLPCSIGSNILGIVSANRADWSYVIYRDPKTQGKTWQCTTAGERPWLTRRAFLFQMMASFWRIHS